MSDQKPGLAPGEFLADGEVRKAWVVETVGGTRILPTHPDLPAAVEALRALVPEPFEWRGGGTGCYHRYHGGRVEFRWNSNETWKPENEDSQSVFNAGRRWQRERQVAEECADKKERSDDRP